MHKTSDNLERKLKPNISTSDRNVGLQGGHFAMKAVLQ